MLRSGLIVRGTILGYDDWGYGVSAMVRHDPKTGHKLHPSQFTLDPRAMRGEARAHFEAAAKFGMVCEPLEGMIQHGAGQGMVRNQALFRVVAVRAPGRMPPAP